MNIPNVLTPMNTESISPDSKMSKEGVATQGNYAFFSLLFNNVMGTFVQAEGQKSEEKVDETSPTKDNLAALSIMGQNSYLQILQNLFPAGKEANSGLENEQKPEQLSLLDIFPTDQGEIFYGGNLQGINGNEAISNFFNNIKDSGAISSIEMAKYLTAEQASFIKDAYSLNQIPVIDQSIGSKVALSHKDYGLEGIINPGLGEMTSLTSTELDKYIEIVEQLKELSGTVELKTNPKTDIGESVNKYGYFSVDQTLNENGKVNIENTLDIEKTASLDNSTYLSAMIEGKGNQSQTSGQGNSGENYNQDPTDTQSIQAIMDKVDGAADKDNLVDPRLKVPNEGGRAWEQVLDILKRQELNTRKELKELYIQLHPADLGKVNVSLRLENGQLNLVMNASEQATSQILQNNIQELKNGLSEMGVACGTFEMGHQYNGQKGSGGDYSPNDGGNRYKIQEEEIPVLTGFNSYISHNGSGSKINLSA